jgi:UDP-2,3-diacylglucosamine pyrophosphatase LpxH
MPSKRRAIILSDLHMGPDNDLCSFRDDVPLAGLLHRLSTETEAPPTELVLAGDLFDFLQVEGYDGFDTNRSAERFEEILRSPRTAAVMGGFRHLAQRSGLDVTVLAGNHDPELLVPDVRARFEEAIGRRGTILWPDDQPLRPGEGDRLPVWGRALGEEGRRVWVIHGDRWDPLNFFHRQEIRETIGSGRPVALPAGSHLVFEVLQKLKPTYSWIDQLKPEPGVLILLIYLDPPRAKDFLGKHLGLTARMVRGMVEAALKKSDLFGAEDPPPPPEPDTQALMAELLAGALADEPEDRRNLLLAELESHLKGAVSAGPGTLAAHGGIGRLLLRAGLRGFRWADRFQGLDRTDAVQEAARWYLPEDLTALIAGHTHGPRLQGDQRPAYFNTGTWLPVGQIPKGDIAELIDQIEKGPTWPTESPRTFVQVDLGDSIPEVRLFECDETGAARVVGG